MAAFAKPGYTHAAYANFRPHYPSHLFRTLLGFHSPAPTTTHLDLGTGPGTILPDLSPPFTTTHAVDPSLPMLDLAKSLLPPHMQKTTFFHHTPAESLSFLPNNSVSLITAAQSAHWFSIPKIWDELARVCLSPGGTVAFWGYKDCIFPEWPYASRILSEYAYSEKYWGPGWSQPGRERVQGRLRALRPPGDGRWERVERWEYEPRFTEEAEKRTGVKWHDVVEEEAGEEEKDEEKVYKSSSDREEIKGIFGKLIRKGEVMLKKQMKIREVEEYVRTWSAVYNYQEANGKRKRLAEGGEGDSVDECFANMRNAEGWGNEWRDLEVRVEWGHGMVLCKRTGKE